MNNGATTYIDKKRWTLLIPHWGNSLSQQLTEHKEDKKLKNLNIKTY